MNDPGLEFYLISSNALYFIPTFIISIAIVSCPSKWLLHILIHEKNNVDLIMKNRNGEHSLYDIK